MSDGNDMQEIAIDKALADLRLAAPMPSEALLQRVMQDADAALFVPHDVPDPLSVFARYWQEFLQGLGGRTSLAGLGAVAFFGVWIGFSQPASLDGLNAVLLPQDTNILDGFMPGLDSITYGG